MAITEAMSRGTLQQRKALLQRLVVGVEVNSRDEILPTFRSPATPVRVDGSGGGPRWTRTTYLRGRHAPALWRRVEQGERTRPSYGVRWRTTFKGTVRPSPN